MENKFLGICRIFDLSIRDAVGSRKLSVLGKGRKKKGVVNDCSAAEGHVSDSYFGSDAKTLTDGQMSLPDEVKVEVLHCEASAVATAVIKADLNPCLDYANQCEWGKSKDVREPVEDKRYQAQNTNAESESGLENSPAEMDTSLQVAVSLTLAAEEANSYVDSVSSHADTEHQCVEEGICASNQSTDGSGLLELDQPTHEERLVNLCQAEHFVNPVQTAGQACSDLTHTIGTLETSSHDSSATVTLASDFSEKTLPVICFSDITETHLLRQTQGRGRARGRARSRKKLGCNEDIVDQMTAFVNEAGGKKSEVSGLPFIDDGRFDDLVEYSGQECKMYHAQAVSNKSSPIYTQEMNVAECSMETLDRHILEESTKATSCPAASIEKAGYKTASSFINHTFQEDTDTSYESKPSGLPPGTGVPGSSLEIPFSHMAISKPDWMQLDDHSSGSDLCSLSETVTFTASLLKREETGDGSMLSKQLGGATNSAQRSMCPPRDDEDWSSSRHTLQRGSVGRQRHACTGHMSHECSIQLHGCSGSRDQKGDLFSTHVTIPHATAPSVSQQLCSAHGCSCTSKSRPQFDCDHTMYSKPCLEKGPHLERVDLHGGSFISPEHQKPRSFSSSPSDSGSRQTSAKTLLIIPAHAIHSLDSAHQLLHFVKQCMHRREDMQELAFEVLIRMKDEASPGNLDCMQSSREEQYSPAVHSDPVGMMPGSFGKDFHSQFTSGDCRLMNPKISCRSSPHSCHPFMAASPVPQTLALLQSHPSQPPHHPKYKKHFACTSHVLCGAGQQQTTDNFSSRAGDEPSNMLNPHLCPEFSESSFQSEAVKTIHPKIGICRHFCRSPHCEVAQHPCGHHPAENTTSTHTSPVTSDTIRRGVPSPPPSMSESSSSEHLDISFETGKAYDASDSNLEDWTDGSIADTGGVMPGGAVSNEQIKDSHPDEGDLKSSMCTSLSSLADSPLIKSSLKKHSPLDHQKRKSQLQNGMPNTRLQKWNHLGLARFLSMRNIPKSHPSLKVALHSNEGEKKPTQSSSSRWVSWYSHSPGQLAEQNSAASPVSSNMSPQAVQGQSGIIKKSFGSKEKNCIPAFRTITYQPSKSTSFGGRNRHLAAPYTPPFSSDSSVSNRNCWNKSTFSTFFSSYNTKFIDTHCHLDLLFKRQPFKGTFSEYHKQHKTTFPSNFEGCVTVFCNPKTFFHEDQWRPIVEDTGVWMAAGCHPKSAPDFSEWSADSLQRCLKHEKVVALGEIGLDYSKNYKLTSELQKAVFVRQIKIALESQLPLVIHCREAEEDCFKILKQYVPHNYKVHCHCFTSSLTVATCWMSHFTNMYFGLTPLVTYQSATETHKVAEFLPLEKLLLETDAPYFLPGGFNTSTHGLTLSHPGMALTVATRVAELRKMQVENVLVQVRQNTLAMYGI